MGRGDKKTKRGKISMGTYGVVRPARDKKATTAATATPAQSENKTKEDQETA